MNSGSTRFRMRMEWDGVEIFDRLEGRLVPLPGELKNELKQKYYEKAPPDGGLLEKASLDLSLHSFLRAGNFYDDVINSSYKKTAAYASAPRRLYWEITRRCNLNCSSCYNRHSASRSELAFERIVHYAKIFFQTGVYEIRITGGEPTTHPECFRIIEELHDMGYYLSLATNGVFKGDTLKNLIGSPVDWIIISLDGGDAETHDRIRGKGTFERVLHSIKTLAEEKKCRIRINTLIRKDNYRYMHLKGIAEICLKYNIESLNCIPMRPTTNTLKSYENQVSQLQFKEFIEGLNRIRRKYPVKVVTTLDLQHTGDHDRIFHKDKSCAAGREGAVISPFGEIYGCSYSPASDPHADPAVRDKYVAGNITLNSPLEIWNDPARWQIYRDLDRFKHARCKACAFYTTHRCIGNCPIMDQSNPAAFDPYCYVDLKDERWGASCEKP